VRVVGTTDDKRDLPVTGTFIASARTANTGILPAS
jgi:hypothetical protein